MTQPLSEADKIAFELISVSFAHFRQCIIAKADIENAVQYIPSMEEVGLMMDDDPILKNFIFATAAVVAQLYKVSGKDESGHGQLKVPHALSQN